MYTHRMERSDSETAAPNLSTAAGRMGRFQWTVSTVGEGTWTMRRRHLVDMTEMSRTEPREGSLRDPP